MLHCGEVVAHVGQQEIVDLVGEPAAQAELRAQELQLVLLLEGRPTWFWI